MTALQHDIRIALRGFRRSPSFTITSVLILAIGIGMAVAMFTVFDAVRDPSAACHERGSRGRVVHVQGRPQYRLLPASRGPEESRRREQDDA